jgi:Fe(3+) dicitrate transport protein
MSIFQISAINNLSPNSWKRTILIGFIWYCLIWLIIGFTSIYAQDNEVVNNDTLTVDDELIEATLGEVSVIGTPEWMGEIPGAARYIGTEELERYGYADIHRVLRSISGVNIQEEDGFGLRPNIGLRGSGSERSSKITLMEDDVLIAPAPYTAPAAYYFPNMARIHAVKVRKGSSQIIYGPNTTGGAINLISTPIPANLKATGEIGMGQNKSHKLYTALGNTYDRTGFLIEVLQMGNDGFKVLDSGGNTGFGLKDFNGKGMVRSSGDARIYQQFEVRFGYNTEVSDETYLGLTDADFSVQPLRRYAASQQDRMEADHKLLQARHHIQFSDDVYVNTIFYRNTFERNWYKLDQVSGVGIGTILEDANFYESKIDWIRGGDSPPGSFLVKANNREYYSRGIQTRLHLHSHFGNLSHEIELGARFHQDGMDRFQWEDEYRMQNGSMILTKAGVPGTESNRLESADALAFYLQDQLSLGRFTIIPGLRFEYIRLAREDFGSNDPERTGSEKTTNRNNVQVWLPGIGVIYQISEKTDLISGIHKGFAPPGTGASDQTQAEHSINYEAGIRYLREHRYIELIGYLNHYSNLLGMDFAAAGGGGTTRQFNGGEVIVAGIELSSSWNLANQFATRFSIPFSFSYTYTYGEFQNSFSSEFSAWGDVEKGDQLPYLPRNQMNVSLGYENEDFGLTLNAYASSSMRTMAGKGELITEQSTDRLLFMDISGSWYIHQKTRLFLNIRNITDSIYIVSRRPAGVRPGMPRLVSGGIKITI